MKKPVIDGFVFQYAKDSERAKREYVTLQKVKSNIDVENVQSTLNLYKKLVYKKYFVTPVGLSFLKEMRDYLVSLNLEEEVPPVYVVGNGENENTQNPFNTHNYEKLKTENEKLNALKKKMTIAIAALVVIVLGMFFIVITNDNIGYFNVEEKVKNKYSAWQERLANWEEELTQREDAIEQLEEENGVIH